jgi:hypothetical protein
MAASFCRPPALRFSGAAVFSTPEKLPLGTPPLSLRGRNARRHLTLSVYAANFSVLGAKRGSVGDKQIVR